jgi:Ras-related protein Ral-A
VDLEHLRRVSSNEASALASEWNCPYVETSAKTRQNVDQVYTQLMRKIRERKERLQRAEAKSKKGKCLIL